MYRTNKIVMAGLALFVLLFTYGCGAGFGKLPAPNMVQAPAPIQGNGGKFMSPYTSDGVLAKWVDKAISVKAGAAVGSVAGAMVGREVLKQIPFVGGILGQTAGKAIGHEIAISSIGGMEFIKKTSDLSFNSLQDMAVYLYAKHSKHPHYKAALDATFQVYPDLQQAYDPAIRKAPLVRR
ncbi:MAG: hypothetical protein O2807_10705 [bacterium]|nr:hypothetical protein [bacterium]